MATNKENIKNPQDVVIAIDEGLRSNEFDTKPVTNSSHSPEISGFSPSPSPSPSPDRPPRHPPPETPLTRRRSIQGKKTRFGEPSIVVDSQTLKNFEGSPRVIDQPPFIQSRDVGVSSGRLTKEKEKKKVRPDEKEIYKKITSQLTARNRKKIIIKFLVEFLVFSVILSCLVCSLTIKKFEGKLLLGVELWKWFVLLMVTFCGLLATQWVIHVFVFLIEWRFLLKKNVVYFTHGLQSNVATFIWIAVVLGTWGVLIKPAAKKSNNSRVVLDFIKMSLASLLIGSFLWLLKTTFIKILASSFHLNRFFDRIQEAVFQHYVLQTLSGSPVVELARKISNQEDHVGQVSFSEETRTGKKKKVVDWSKLRKMKREQVPSWTVKLLLDVVSNSGLSTMSGMLNENVVEGGVELNDNKITSEEAAIATAVKIFYNVIGDKDDLCIERADLYRFLIWEEVSVVYHFFEVNEKGQIDFESFCKWVVKVYKDRNALQHALNDNKTAVDEFNKILIGILIVIMIILWLLLTGVATTKILLFFSSQLIVAAFIFGNTCKTIFEAIIFVFVMHPFDVGDRCLVDGTMLLVEEMNILTTVFLKIDKEKVYYPNSVLATKPISNFYRSPDQADTLEFGIDYRTPMPKINQLREHIKQYLEKHSYFWHPEHTFIVKEIENVNKLKMILVFNHTMNFQDIIERNKRRTELVLGMKTIFDTLEITYHLLQQEIIVNNIPSNSKLNS